MELFTDSFEFYGEHLDWLGWEDVEGNMVQIIAYDGDMDSVSIMVNNHVAQMPIEDIDEYIQYWL